MTSDPIPSNDPAGGIPQITLRLGTPAVSDEVLLARYAQGDPKAFEAFIRRHQGRVFGYASRLLVRHELAAEATQECFLKLHAKIHLYRLGEPALRWFFVIVHRTCLDLRRREHKHDPSKDPLHASQLTHFMEHQRAGWPHRDNGDRDDSPSEVALAAMQKLPEDAQRLLNDRIFKDQSFDELAKETKRSSSALRKAYSRLVAKLRADMGLGSDESQKETKHEK